MLIPLLLIVGALPQAASDSSASDRIVVNVPPIPPPVIHNLPPEPEPRWDQWVIVLLAGLNLAVAWYTRKVLVAQRTAAEQSVEAMRDQHHTAEASLKAMEGQNLAMTESVALMRAQAQAVTESNFHAKQRAHAELRAYIAIVENSVKVEITPTTMTSRFIFDVTNCGKTPAHDVWVETDISIGIPKLWSVDYMCQDAEAKKAVSVGVIGPGRSDVVPMQRSVPHDELPDGQDLYISIGVGYRDIFGDRQFTSSCNALRMGQNGWGLYLHSEGNHAT